MRERATPLAVALGLALAGMACGGPETTIVNQYFTALQANDTSTLTGFASVTLDKEVESWQIVSASEESRAEATLPGLVANYSKLQAEHAANKKEYRAWGNDLEVYPKLQRIKELRKDEKKIPSSLQATEEKLDAYNAKDDELLSAVADAKNAAAREKRITQLSVGERDGIEALTGEVVSKTVTLDLTIDGQVQPYSMGLRKYDLQDDGSSGRMVSRWVVYSLDPAS